MKTYAVGDYYMKNKKSMLRDYEKMKKLSEPLLAKRFNNEQIQQILIQSRSNFEELLPQLPYIGGKKNSGTKNLTGSAIILAFIQALEPQNIDEREIGFFIYELFEALFSSKPKFIRKLSSKLIRSKFGMKRIKQRYQKNAFSEYKGGWSRTLVEQKEETFAFGIDVTECGICTLLKQQNAEKYIPYLCLGDYPMFGMMNISLHRSKTIANGDDVCDFRFYFDEEPRKGWPPEALEEWKKD